jgi:predicted dehydrogenase
LTRAPVRSVSASGWAVVTRHLDVVAARVEFEDGLVAELSASRASSRQVRSFSVLDRKGLLEVDLAGRRLRRNTFQDGVQRTEELALESGDALLEQDRSFVHVLRNGRRPIVCGETGRAVVELAARIEAAADRSASQ